MLENRKKDLLVVDSAHAGFQKRGLGGAKQYDSRALIGSRCDSFEQCYEAVIVNAGLNYSCAMFIARGFAKSNTREESDDQHERCL